MFRTTVLVRPVVDNNLHEKKTGQCETEGLILTKRSLWHCVALSVSAPTARCSNPLRLHLPEQQCLRRVRTNRPPHLNLRISLGHTVRHLDIIIQNHLRNNHLNLIGGKEPSGTCMASIPKRQILLIRGHELVARVISRTAVAAQLVVPEAVEASAVGVNCTVIVDGL